MPVTYTTSALVRKRVKNISSELTDDDIDQFIYEAEGIIDETMGFSVIASFDATEHTLIRSCATDLAALKAIANDPGTVFLSLDDAELTISLLQESVGRTLALLTGTQSVPLPRSTTS